MFDMTPLLAPSDPPAYLIPACGSEAQDDA